MVHALGCEPSAPPTGEPERTVVYETRRFLRGLDEWVVVTKTPHHTIATRANGDRVDWSDLRAQDQSAWEARHGRMTPQMAELLDATPGGQISAMVAFGSETSADARQALLSSYDVDITAIARHAPLAAIRGDVSELNTLARDPLIAVLDVGEYGEPVQDDYAGSSMCPDTSPGALDPVSFHAIDQLNSAGNFGDGYLVGLVEAAQHGKCGFFAEHQAFAKNAGSPLYGTSPNACTADFQCQMVTGFCDTCVNGYCTSAHATQVASVVSQNIDFGSGEVERSASEVRFVMSNTASSTACSTSGLITIYDFMLESGVLTANETFGCTGGFDYGLVEDYYQLSNPELLVVTSSGNDHDSRACRGTSNSLCVGGAYYDPTLSDYNVSCFQSDLNPLGSDREEPDLVGSGGSDSGCSSYSTEVLVADPSVDCCWTGNVGTSFAAPAATAVATLHRERCEPTQGTLTGRRLRAVMRTMAYSGNPDGVLRYSTPKEFDYADGAGLLTAFLGCGEGGPEGLTTGDGDDPDHDLSTGGSLPGGDVEYDPGFERETGRDSWGLYTTPTSSSRVGRQIGSGSWKQGQRIRWTVAWDACIASASSGTAASPATDFDVFLFNATTGAYIYGSQSVDDVNEGFDVVLQSSDLSSPSATDDFEIWLSWPDDAEGCGGGTNAPYAQAWAIFAAP
ncbi:MAG: S8 family serine peptidase [Sandaracinaceae bacterium]